MHGPDPLTQQPMKVQVEKVQFSADQCNAVGQGGEKVLLPGTKRWFLPGGT